ncbi:MAG TPA: hypothetical protein VHI13_17460 [Candidatus Kapabacteria bacterium]|nr:hypothetical protein [Candidatus Kapabacteria bacterium]
MRITLLRIASVAIAMATAAPLEAGPLHTGTDSDTQLRGPHGTDSLFAWYHAQHMCYCTSNESVTFTHRHGSAVGASETFARVPMCGYGPDVLTLKAVAGRLADQRAAAERH